MVVDILCVYISELICLLSYDLRCIDFFLIVIYILYVYLFIFGV